MAKSDELHSFTWFQSYVSMNKCKWKIKKNELASIKTPYILISTHGSNMDCFAVQRLVFPRHAYHLFGNEVINEELINKVKVTLDKGNIVIIYPEVATSRDGTTSIMNRDIAKIIKEAKVPVAVARQQGTYLHDSCWSKYYNNNLVESEAYMLLSDKECESLDNDQLMDRIEESLEYNEYDWIKTNNIIIDKKNRCEGLERILYKCPQCLEENKIVSTGDKIHCSSCGKQWVMTDYGDMKAVMDDTEYASIPDWYNFQRDCIREEIVSGKYENVIKVRIEELENNRKNNLVGVGVLWHNIDGFVLKFNNKGKDDVVVKSSEDMYSCNVDYDYNGQGACIELISEDYKYRVYPMGNNTAVTKLMLAVEEIHKFIVETKTTKNTKSNEEVVTVEVDELIKDEENIEKNNEGKVIAVEYVDDNVMSSEDAMAIRQVAKTVETNEV